MTMNSLEHQVREALIEQRASRLFDLMQGKPTGEVFANNCILVFQAMAQAAAVDEPFEVATEHAKKLQDDPTALYDLARKTAKTYFLSAQEYDTLFGYIFEDVAKIPQGDARLAVYRAAFLPLYGKVGMQQKVIDALVAVADEKGVEAALEPEAVAHAVQQVFPTKIRYLTHQDDLYEVPYNFIGKMETLCRGNTTTQAKVEKALGKLRIALQRRYEAMHELRTVELNERADMLYD